MSCNKDSPASPESTTFGEMVSVCARARARVHVRACTRARVHVCINGNSVETQCFHWLSDILSSGASSLHPVLNAKKEIL